MANLRRPTREVRIWILGMWTVPYPKISIILASNNYILLRFAPSAAAVWHCDRERRTCERNSARHSVFPFKRLAGQYVFAPVFSPRKYKNNKNKTKQNNNNCSPFLTGKVWVSCLQVCPQTCSKNRTECSPFFW